MTDQELNNAATAAICAESVEHCIALNDELAEEREINNLFKAKYNELLSMYNQQELYCGGLLKDLGRCSRLARNKKRSTIGVLYGLLATGLAIWGLWR